MKLIFLFNRDIPSEPEVFRIRVYAGVELDLEGRQSLLVAESFNRKAAFCRAGICNDCPVVYQLKVGNDVDVAAEADDNLAIISQFLEVR